MIDIYPAFLQIFDNVPDPRYHRSRLHNLSYILFIALCSALTGGKSFVDMEDLATAQEEWFKQFIPMVGGPPSHDTFNRVFQTIAPECFETCFRAKEGADSFATIMSYIGTANKHGINSFLAIKGLLLVSQNLFLHQGD